MQALNLLKILQILIEKTIKEAINICLEKLVELNLKSIAFPAIGTGVLEYPVDLVASEMFQAAKEFCLYKPNANITVTFVVYNQDSNMIKVKKTINIIRKIKY